jgi:hypothetical protein
MVDASECGATQTTSLVVMIDGLEINRSLPAIQTVVGALRRKQVDVFLQPAQYNMGYSGDETISDTYLYQYSTLNTPELGVV